MNPIQRKRMQIERRLSNAQQEMNELRTVCPHTDVSRLAKADTGNWSPSDDRYWDDCVCLHCGKHWTEDK